MAIRIPYTSLPIAPEWGDQDPTIPLYGYFPDAPVQWMARHDQFNDEAEARRREINVVFLGDSITEGWGKQVKPYGTSAMPHSARQTLGSAATGPNKSSGESHTVIWII